MSDDFIMWFWFSKGDWWMNSFVLACSTKYCNHFSKYFWLLHWPEGPPTLLTAGTSRNQETDEIFISVEKICSMKYLKGIKHCLLSSGSMIVESCDHQLSCLPVTRENVCCMCVWGGGVCVNTERLPGSQTSFLWLDYVLCVMCRSIQFKEIMEF
jgi:hypothetical protein